MSCQNPERRHKGFTLAETDLPLLEKLSKAHREILTTPGSYEDVSAALNIPKGTVKSRTNRARSALVKLRES